MVSRLAMVVRAVGSAGMMLGIVLAGSGCGKTPEPASSADAAPAAAPAPAVESLAPTTPPAPAADAAPTPTATTGAEGAPPAAPPEAPRTPEELAFESDGAEAMKNVGTTEGANYDAALGRYLAGLPDYRTGVRKCIDENPGKQTVFGVMRFDAQGAYKVELRPPGSFATCMTAFLEKRDPPKPPKLPYLNPVSFTTEP